MKEAVRSDLSVVAQTGAALWLASDETSTIERLTTTDWTQFGNHQTFRLADLFPLPDPSGGEVDIEGVAVDGGYLWIVGSHSLARRRPKLSEHDTATALRRLTQIKFEHNRFFLGRAPLIDSPVDGAPTIAPAAPGRVAACLEFTKRGNRLTSAIADDPTLAPFLRIPAKENGFDIEGIAVRGDQVFLGLRGPVLRGWAVVLELTVRHKDNGALGLAPIGPAGARFRTHFIDLDGLGVRELDFVGDDLLILAGPTMDLDGPIMVYRWADAAHIGDQQIVPRDRLTRLLDVPYGLGFDHAEGMTVYRAPDAPPRLLIAYDNPGESRLHGPDDVELDLFALPPDIS
ncbi:MAG: DUF3616 domain-containing protein [Dehalococcoidia bacterium]|nr:DUF3616 domain-containing protein [Dehalococcoidia bacterium]